MDRDELDGLLSWGWTLEQIGAHYGRHPATVSYRIKKYGLEAVNKEKHASRGGIDRTELEEMVNRGMTIAEIAVELDRSKATIGYWLRRHDLRTQHKVGRRMRDDLSAAKAAGLTVVAGECERHGQVEFVLEGRGRYRCKQCRIDAINRRRRKIKAVLVAEAGGKCRLCGYDRCPSALQFHHLDPRQKRLNVSARGAGLALETLRAEARKCVLLCSNCHAEVEHGAAEVPLE